MVRIGDPEKLKFALSALTDAIRFDPTMVEAYIARSTVWAERGERGKAREDLEAARQLGGDDALIDGLLEKLGQ